MSNSKNLAKLLLIPILLFTINTSYAEVFSDVNPGNENYLPITTLAEKGIISGYENETFKSYNDINRAEALKMILLAGNVFTEEEINDTKVSEAIFNDVQPENWFAKYVKVAKDNEIINGYSDNTFHPEKNINLAEMLKIYLESLQNLAYPKTEDWLFADTPLNAWFTKYTSYAGSRGMINIWASNNVHPEQTMTRGNTASIIYKKLKFKEGYRFGKATFYGKAVQGHYTASGEIFDLNKLTAAHKSLPFGTIVEATNLANGKSVQVRITDRGPYGPGRVLDLTTEAFSRIASPSLGIINIQYKVVTQ